MTTNLLGVNNLLGSNILGDQHFWGVKLFWRLTYFGGQNKFGAKHFGVQHFFGVKICRGNFVLDFCCFYTARSAGQKGCVNMSQLRVRWGPLEFRAVIG